MVKPAVPEESAWIEALGQAGDDRLFLETRRDLSLNLVGEGRIRAIPTYASGLSAEGAEAGATRLTLADPRPEDAAGLLEALHGRPAAVPPARSASSTGPRLDATGPSRLLLGLADGFGRHASDLSLRASWIGSNQEVYVAGHGDPPSMDRRSGARLRLEASLKRRETIARAVVERTLRLDQSLTGDEQNVLKETLWQRVEERLEARRPQPGPHRIVLAPGVGGVLVHELFGHALEADVVAASNSWLSNVGVLKELVGSKELTVLDDPRRCRTPWRMDDEGVPTRPTALLREGRVVGQLHDRRSAGRASQEPTGHGRRSSFREPIQPRMGCTFVSAGRRVPREVLEESGDGIYIRRMEAGRTDIRTGSALFRVTDADRLVAGRTDAPLEPFLLQVEGPTVLGSIKLIGDDVAFDTCVGSCHRAGQPLSTSVGAPTMCIGLAEVLV